jgi:hypothetical protein
VAMWTAEHLRWTTYQATAPRAGYRTLGGQLEWATTPQHAQTLRRPGSGTGAGDANRLQLFRR